MTVASELQQTLAELHGGFTGSGYIELPKPERLVNRAWHQSLAIRRKRDQAGGGTVPSKTVHKGASHNAPDAYDCIDGADALWRVIPVF